MEITCMDCKTELPLKVCHSAAGFYLGYFCPNCGPYDRVSGYMTEGEAINALKSAKRNSK